MAVYITGDIHGQLNRFLELRRFCKMHDLTNKDWIICLGDVGLNYYGGQNDEVAKSIAATIPANLFCIHGNHEFRPSKKCGYHTRKINGNITGRVWWDAKYPNQFFAIDGEVYKIIADHEEFNALVCGGAYSVDKYYRLEHGWNWFPDEQPDEKVKKKVMKAICPDIDFVLTHTCPTSYIPAELFLEGIDQSKVDKSTEEFLEDVLNMFKESSKDIMSKIPPWDLKHHQGENLPRWYFGHYHGEKYTKNYTMLYKDIIPFGYKENTNG